MIKKNNNLIFGTLAVLAIMVFGLTLSPTSANAYTVVGSGFYAYESNGTSPVDNTGNGTGSGNVSTVDGGTTTNGAYNTSASAPKATTKVAKTSTSTSASSAGPSVVTKSASVLDANTANSSNLNLSANASSSKFSFLPSTLLGWLLLFIIIFLAVILWRKIYVTEKEKNTPLKHA